MKQLLALIIGTGLTFYFVILVATFLKLAHSSCPIAQAYVGDTLPPCNKIRDARL